MRNGSNDPDGVDSVVALIREHPDTAKVPGLGPCFEHLARRAESHGYTIELRKDPNARFEGSSHDKACKTVYLATTHEGSGDRRTVTEIVGSLAHEIGHIEDPERPGDSLLLRGSDPWWRRTLEREGEAWRRAREMLETETCWEKIEETFTAAQTEALEKYRELSRSASNEPMT